MGIWRDKSQLWESLTNEQRDSSEIFNPEQIRMGIDLASGPDRNAVWYMDDIWPRGRPLAGYECTNNVVIQMESMDLDRLNELIATINIIENRLIEAMLIPAELLGPAEPEPDGWVEY